MELEGVESATRTLHTLTSYDPSRAWDEAKDDPRLLHDFQPNDANRRPFFTKRYVESLPRTPLPRDLPIVTSPALNVLAGTVLAGTVLAGTVLAQTALPAASRLDLAGLSRVLHLSAGVVRTAQTQHGTHLFRAAGSAGGRFPLELYVAIPEGDASERADIPPGVHWYDPVEHALVQVGPAPRHARADSVAGTTPRVTTAAVTIVVTGIPWRTGWRYRERGFRHIYWDAGTMLSQLLALADSAGFSPQLHTRFPDAGVSELIGADQVHEWPVALIAFGAGDPAIDAAGTAVAGEIDSAPLEFPLVTAAQRAGDMDRLEGPWDTGEAVKVPDLSGTDSASLDDVITKRGSQRRMDPGRGLSLNTLRTSMAIALRGIDIDHWVAIHDVTGLEPGIYRWPDLGKPISSGSRAQMRAELYRVCLEQALARDAAFVVIAATDVSQLSDREYREAQLAAGIVEGRLHLAAYALGAGATGMTFIDSEIPALLGAQDQPTGYGSGDGLLFTCVGVPANTSKPAGSPGTPTAIRMVKPRE